MSDKLTPAERETLNEMKKEIRNWTSSRLARFRYEMHNKPHWRELVDSFTDAGKLTAFLEKQASREDRTVAGRYLNDVFDQTGVVEDHVAFGPEDFEEPPVDDDADEGKTTLIEESFNLQEYIDGVRALCAAVDAIKETQAQLLDSVRGLQTGLRTLAHEMRTDLAKESQARRDFEGIALPALEALLDTTSAVGANCSKLVERLPMAPPPKAVDSVKKALEKAEKLRAEVDKPDKAEAAASK